MNSLWAWLGIGAVLTVIEVLTLDLVFIMFAAGALAAGLTGLAGANLVVQIVVGAVVTVVGLFVVRPLGIRHLKSARPDSDSNIDAIIGRRCRVLTDVTPDSGTAEINGETWSARVPEGNDSLPAGSTAIIVTVDGAYLILGPDIWD